MSRPRIPEKDKKPGVHYAFTNDGIELPVVDVTHPAFALSVTDAEQRAAVDAFLRERREFAKLPRAARDLLLRIFLRGSMLARGIRQSQGSFLAGMDTYLLKLGADNLGKGYSKPIDRKIAASLPAVAIRWRVQDMARLLADALGPVLADPSHETLHFIDIAGGPAADCLNALILLHREHPGALAKRRIAVNVLDGDDRGPAFGARALRALQEDGGPLAGLSIEFRQIAYDWRHTADLRTALRELRAENPWMIGSSEGGLFEYGSDDEIVENLHVLGQETPSGFVMVGSVTRADEPVRRLKETSTAATRPRGLDVFRALIGRAGWKIERAIERPFSDHVAITRS